ncbi:hypothetical protein ACRAKI_10425 [Saccharothrix isguenensis]
MLSQRRAVASPKPRAETHRAALRHCEAMDVELAEEVARLQSLLSSMSTFAVAQDGVARQRSTMAAAAAAGLGLPALVLSLWGGHVPAVLVRPGLARAACRSR